VDRTKANGGADDGAARIGGAGTNKAGKSHSHTRLVLKTLLRVLVVLLVLKQGYTKEATQFPSQEYLEPSVPLNVIAFACEQPVFVCEIRADLKRIASSPPP
jgi:hypothetical protein